MSFHFQISWKYDEVKDSVNMDLIFKKLRLNIKQINRQTLFGVFEKKMDKPKLNI